MLNPGIKDTISASALPTGASTSAKQDTQITNQNTENAHLTKVEFTSKETNETVILLEKILITLRKIEIHLSEGSGSQIDDGEIDEES